jgi:hypothetical protein
MLKKRWITNNDDKNIANNLKYINDNKFKMAR